MLTVFGLQEIGGWQQMVDTSRDGAMSLWRSANDTDYPWTAILFGAPILGVWYWCTDQFIVQRALAARNISTARKATIFAGFLKLTPMFLFVVPGMIAYTYSQTNLEFANQIGDGAAALPVMVQAMLPAGLRGLVAAGILSALMSSLSSVFNSCSTLITLDIYKKYKPNTSEKKLVRVGQIATLFLVAIGILWIPFQESLSAGGLFKYIQGIQAYVAPPIAAAPVVVTKPYAALAEPADFPSGSMASALKFAPSRPKRPKVEAKIGKKSQISSPTTRMRTSSATVSRRRWRPAR